MYTKMSVKVCQKYVFSDLNSFLYVVQVWTTNICFHAGSGGTKPLIFVEVNLMPINGLRSCTSMDN